MPTAPWRASRRAARCASSLAGGPGACGPPSGSSASTRPAPAWTSARGTSCRIAASARCVVPCSRARAQRHAAVAQVAAELLRPGDHPRRARRRLAPQVGEERAGRRRGRVLAPVVERDGAEDRERREAQHLGGAVAPRSRSTTAPSTSAPRRTGASAARSNGVGAPRSATSRATAAARPSSAGAATARSSAGSATTTVPPSASDASAATDATPPPSSTASTMSSWMSAVANIALSSHHTTRLGDHRGWPCRARGSIACDVGRSRRRDGRPGTRARLPGREPWGAPPPGGSCSAWLCTCSTR